MDDERVWTGRVQMRTGQNATTSLIRRARQIEEAAKTERLRERDDLRKEVESFVADPESWREYLKTVVDYPRRAPEEVVALTRYRLDLGFERLSRLMCLEELAAAGRAPREGAEGVELTATSAMGPRAGKTTLFAIEDTVATDGQTTRPPAPKSRKVDTSDPEAMDAFVAAAGKCDLDALTPQAEYVVSICYGLDFEDDPVPPLPPARTAAELYEALERVGQSVDEVQRKIDAALSNPHRARRAVKKGARPPKEMDDGTPRSHDPKVIGRRDAEKRLGPRAPTRDELCAMTAEDVAKAVRHRRKGHGS